MARHRPLVPLPWHPISAIHGMMVPALIDQYLPTELEKVALLVPCQSLLH